MLWDLKSFSRSLVGPRGAESISGFRGQPRPAHLSEHGSGNGPPWGGTQPRVDPLGRSPQNWAQVWRCWICFQAYFLLISRGFHTPLVGWYKKCRHEGKGSEKALPSLPLPPLPLHQVRPGAIGVLAGVWMTSLKSTLRTGTPS